MTGKRIVHASWASLALFGAVSIPDTLGLHALEDATTAVSLALFGIGIAVWLYAFAYAVVRSARGDDIVVASWVFLDGSAPAGVRRHLLGATGVSIVLAAIAAVANPFGVLVPLLPLGLAALWGARHGAFPPRRTPTDTRRRNIARGGAR